MSLTLVTAPAVEPVTLAELKLFLRVDNTDEDAEVSQIGVDAREYVEQRANEALITQTWRASIDVRYHHAGIAERAAGNGIVPERFGDKVLRGGYWPTRQTVLRFPMRPLQDVSSITYRQAGQDVAVDLNTVRTEPDGRIIFLPGALPILTDEAAAAVHVEAVVGYGDAGADVPGSLIRAIKLLAAHWYENRGLYYEATQGRSQVDEMAAGLTDLLKGKRVLGL